MPSSARVRARAVAMLAVAAAVSLALSGCAAALLFIPVPSTPTPTAGDCWESSFDKAAGSAAWTGDAVACSAGHQLYTYAIANVPSSATTWRTSSGGMERSIESAASDACAAKLTAFLPELPVGGILTDFFFVPSETQWANGARWVRCDLAQLTFGSLLSKPDFVALPSIAALTVQVRDDPSEFADCVLTTDPSGATGPYDDPQARYADCRGSDYQWSFQSNFTVPGAVGDPYPSDAVIAQLEQESCGDLAAASKVGWIAYVPSPDDWTGGFRGGSCWFFANDSGGTTT